MFDLFEELIQEYDSDNSLIEKWYTGSDPSWQRLWYSDSISQFRSFLKNASSAGIKGLRLCIRPGCYLAARASDLNHDMIVETAKELYLIDGSLKFNDFEASTCGFPSLDDFHNDNFEGLLESLKDTFLELEDGSIMDTQTGEILFGDSLKNYYKNVKSTKNRYMCANCDTFEISLYNFKSVQLLPEYKHPRETDVKSLETSETWKVIQPLVEYLYITD